MLGNVTAESDDERRRGADRRQQLGAPLPFADRRRGPRRRAELPRAPWPSLLLAGTLGVLSALAAQGTLAASADGARAIRPLAVASATVRPDPVAARRCSAANALRDRAEALTPAGVMSEEPTLERWLEVAEATAQRQASGVDIGACERDALRATHSALVRVGVLRP
jgi:hypothetical protein